MLRELSDVDALIVEVVSQHDAPPIDLIELFDSQTFRNRVASVQTDPDVQGTIATLRDAETAPSLRAISRASGIPMSSLHHRNGHAALATAVGNELARIFADEIEQQAARIRNPKMALAAALGFWMLMARDEPGLTEFLVTAPGIRMIDGVSLLFDQCRSNNFGHVASAAVASLAFGTTARCAYRDASNEPDGTSTEQRLLRLLAVTTSP